MSSVIVSAVGGPLPSRAELERRASPWCARPRRLDDLCLAGLVVSGEARIAAERNGLDDLAAHRHALVLGTAFGCTESDYEYYTQILERGLRRTNPRIFAYTLPNVVLGEVAIRLVLPGDNLAFSAGRASGLVALGEAHTMIVAGEIDAALVLAIDTAGPAAERLFGALGTRPEPIMAGFVLASSALAEAASGAAGRITGYRCWMEPDATVEQTMDPDPLGCGGVLEVLAGRSATVRCSSGHAAELVLADGA